MLLIVICCVVIYLLVVKILKYLSIEDEVVEVSDKEVITIEKLNLPQEIEKINATVLSTIIPKIFETYKKFDYKNASEINLDKKEWHSWQISMIMKLYKYNKEFYIKDKGEIFPNSILDLNMKSLNTLMQSFVMKYDNNVKISKTKDDLCKDTIWTSREVSAMFYFLSKYKG